MITTLGVVLQVSSFQKGDGRVSGTAVDSLTDRPLPGAFVQIDGRTTLTGPNGAFYFEGISTGRHLLVVDKDNYKRGSLAGTLGNPNGAVISVGPDDSATNLIVEMVPTGVLTARVTDKSAKPIRGAIVRLYQYGYSHAGKRELIEITRLDSDARKAAAILQLGIELSPPGRRPRAGVTDDRGLFRIFNLPEGTYIVSIEVGGQCCLYYPGVTDPAIANSTEVFSGRETNLGKITFISPAMSRLSVIATNETTMSASRVNLIVKPRGVDHIVGTTNPSSLPFGEYDIYAFTGKLPQFLAVAQTSIPLFLSHERVSLSLKQGARLTGSVVSEMPNRWVPVFGAELILGSRDVLESASFSLRSAQDGTFKMESVPSGRFKVKQLISPDGLCTESVTQESRDVLRQGMEVRGDSIHLQWIMTTTNLRVQGVVKHPSGKHLPNATIILVHSNLEMDSLDYTTVADQNGRFEINCVVPGRYRAYALESSDRVALVRSEQFQASFQGLLTEINTSRGITNLDIEAILGR